MGRYFTEETTTGFWVRGNPHPLDVPGQAEWLVELAYDHSGARRHPAHVTQGPCYLQVEGNFSRSPERLALPDCYGLVETIAGCLLSGWQFNAEHWDHHDDYWPFHWLKPWLLKQTSRSIAFQVRDQWERLLNGIHPTVLEIQKAVFSANFGLDLSRSVILQENLYRERFLVNDIQAFRAAQIAAGVMSSIDKMQQWRFLFCPSGVSPYTSLNKTLNSLPGGVPARLLFRLRHFTLPRPITNRLELIATILAAQETNFHVVAHADAGEIVEAMQKVGTHLHRQFNPRRWRDVQDVLQFLCDFPDEHPGRILGLADKSIIWHRDCQGEEIRKCIGELGHDTALARPPIPLPDITGVRFLATVGDVCDEAERMGHCIASYAKRAYDGQCYLFHVDYDGDAASVEVNAANGHVVQSQGKRNQPNRATAWAAKTLSQWGRVLRCAAKLTTQCAAQPMDQGITQQDVSVAVTQRQILARVLRDVERKESEPALLSEMDFFEELRRM